MRSFLSKVGEVFAAVAPMLVTTATVGVCGEIEPPECLK
jgi:hypothetical protein